MMNIIIKIVGIFTIYYIGFVVYNLCACKDVPAGDKVKIKCQNTSGQPGIVCTVPNMIFKVIFKISVFIWKAFVLLHNLCMNPIYPV